MRSSEIMRSPSARPSRPKSAACGALLLLTLIAASALSGCASSAPPRVQIRTVVVHPDPPPPALTAPCRRPEPPEDDDMDIDAVTALAAEWALLARECADRHRRLAGALQR